MFGLIHFLCCHAKCSPTRLASMAAFVPPQPGSYTIHENKLRSELSRNPIATKNIPYEAMFLEINPNFNMPCVYIRIVQNENAGVLIFAHGNATDLGLTFDSLADLAERLQINIFAFDYEGYGPNWNTTEPSVTSAHKCLETAYTYLVTSGKCKNPKENMILYGQSLGSVFVCKLATKYSKFPIAGIILHSPLASGIRLLLQNPGCFVILDVFPNEKRISKSKCPVFIIHGILDTQIPINHAYAVYQAIPAKYRYPPFYAPRADHNNVEFAHRDEYYIKIDEFIKKCLNINDQVVTIS